MILIGAYFFHYTYKTRSNYYCFLLLGKREDVTEALRKVLFKNFVQFSVSTFLFLTANFSREINLVSALWPQTVGLFFSFFDRSSAGGGSFRRWCDMPAHEVWSNYFVCVFLCAETKISSVRYIYRRTILFTGFAFALRRVGEQWAGLARYNLSTVHTKRRWHR